ncbi:MAG: T9SS type A sorting domain-containing protein [Chitinophagaceae bacterium]|nr:T9SS type A sorting domain-containing protein [Chitinophagaceae bacterium]
MKPYIALICFVFINLLCHAQKQAHVWYFGNDGAGLNFGNECLPTVLTDGKIDGFEGCASIADPVTGQLLFYTNSEWIWDKNHDTMPNSSLITNGKTITQVLILQKPNSNSQYYIITSEVQGFSGQGYRYHLVDMTLNAGLGGVVFKDSQMYAGPVTEKITAIRHSNGTDIWIIGHQYNSNQYLSFLLTPTGINTTPVVSAIGKIHADPSTADAIGELKASPDGSHIASVTMVHPDIELFQFNNLTGQLSNLITLPELGGYDGLGNGSGLYGLSFSANSKMLYASQWLLPSSSTSGKIIQYDISSNDSSIIANSRVNVFTSTTLSLYSLKLAPDQKIYVAHNTSKGFLGVIHSPDSAGFSCNYVDSAIYLNGKHCGWGLNNLMEYSEYCIHEPNSILTTQNEKPNITVFPNPANQHIHITITPSHNKEYTLSIYNYMGQRVLYIPHFSSGPLNRSTLKPGIYFYRIESGHQPIGAGQFILE